MKNKLEIVDFIENNPDWETKLQEKPYCITISRDKMFGLNLIMFKYNQIDSDFNVELVRECRGLILNEDTLEPVSVPFFKFGNYGESYCPNIDWSTCWVGEKLDGSLAKVVKIGGSLIFSTNGTIDAFKAPLVEQIGCNAKTFGDLIEDAVCNAYISNTGITPPYKGIAVDWLKNILEENKTYMFELTSPFNKVVVTWHDTRLNFLGVRDNNTLQETYFLDHKLKNYFNTPRVFPLHSLQECIDATSQLGPNDEGYVICDKNFNRVKVKSVLYCSLHHMKGNGVLSYERGLDIIKSNEIGEVVTYFPEFKDHLEQIKLKYEKLICSLETSWKYFVDNESTLASRKEAAIWIQKNFEIPGVGFSMLDKKINSIREWVEKCPTKNLVKYLGFKDTGK